MNKWCCICSRQNKTAGLCLIIIIKNKATVTWLCCTSATISSGAVLFPHECCLLSGTFNKKEDQGLCELEQIEKELHSLSERERELKNGMSLQEKESTITEITESSATGMFPQLLFKGSVLGVFRSK